MLDQLEIPVAGQDDSQTMSENVFRRIQAAIVKGEIAPGSKISEPELARTYGISRGPLREAIHRLEGQRLLVRVPHVGARVVSLSSHSSGVCGWSATRRRVWTFSTGTWAMDSSNSTILALCGVDGSPASSSLTLSSVAAATS